MSNEKEYLKEEIRKEFQLERMVLFSDAVFAIAITLMAIEIKIPHITGMVSEEEFLHQLKPVLPVILAYLVSFFFVGYTWYQHLQLFSLLKDYNKGVVVRNLLMLLFIGLFPFGASVISAGYSGTMFPMFIYVTIMLLCKLAQHILHHYILIQHPELCIHTDISEHKTELDKSRAALIGFVIVIVLVIVTSLIISTSVLKSLSVLWFAIFPLIMKIFRKKKGKKHTLKHSK
jgi:uncharacterized membrane protein